MLVNIDKTKRMVFNITQAWVTRSEAEFFLGEEKLAYTQSDTGLDSPWEAVCAQLPHVYAALGVVERQ